MRRFQPAVLAAITRQYATARRRLLPAVQGQVPLGRTGRKAQRHQPAGPAEAHTRPGAGTCPRPARPPASRAARAGAGRAAALHPRSAHAQAARPAPRRPAEPISGSSPPRPGQRPGPPGQPPRCACPGTPARPPFTNPFTEHTAKARKIIPGPLTCTFVAGQDLNLRPLGYETYDPRPRRPGQSHLGRPDLCPREPAIFSCPGSSPPPRPIPQRGVLLIFRTADPYRISLECAQ